MNQPRVLIVDESLTALGLLGGVLRSIGFDVHQVRTGDEAMRVLVKPNEFFDLIVLDETDAEAEGLGGSEFGRVIHRLTTHMVTPIVMLSGKANDDLNRVNRASGIVGCFDKAKVRDAGFNTCAQRFYDHFMSVNRPEALVVDDSLTARSLLAGYLREVGFDVVGIEKSAEAIRVIKKRGKADPYGIILINEGLPLMRGEELGEWIKRHDVYEKTPMFLMNVVANPMLGEILCQACGFKRLTC